MRVYDVAREGRVVLALLDEPRDRVVRVLARARPALARVALARRVRQRPRRRKPALARVV